VHRLSGVSSPVNAAYTVSELCHQLESSKARVIFTCLPLLDNALAAAERCRISPSRIYLLSMPQEYVSHRQSRKDKCFKTVDQLVDLGATLPEIEPLKWQPGQGARQCAFLMYSSGTTGFPVREYSRSNMGEI
jgi:long-subunit acyl-CoA synthetase (AMP-forming)